MVVADAQQLKTIEYELREGEIDPETGLPYIPYPSEDDEVPESFDQFDLVIYLTNLLRWLYRKEKWLVLGGFMYSQNSS